MGVEDIFEGTVNITEAGLAELDKIAEAQEKKLKKIQAQNKKRGGIFAEDTGDLPKSFERQQEESALQRIQKLAKDGKINLGGTGAPIQHNSSFQKAIDDAVARSTSKLDKLTGSKLGTDKLDNLLSFGKNPVGFMTNLFARQLPILGGILAVKDIVQFVIGELMKPGGPLQVNFRDIISTRLDAFRDKMVQQEILSGFTQVIYTTRAGTTNPRSAYNSFELFNNDKETLEDDFSIRVSKVN